MQPVWTRVTSPRRFGFWPALGLCVLLTLLCYTLLALLLRSVGIDLA